MIEKILERIESAVKENENITLYIPLDGNYEDCNLQSIKPEISLKQVITSNKQVEVTQENDLIVNDSRQSDPVPFKNAKPDAEVVLNPENPVEENKCPVIAVPQPINYFEEMKKTTDILHIINRYDSELEKRNSTLLKQYDQQNINNIRYNLSRIQPIPLSDDKNFNNRFPLYVLPTPYQNLLKAVAHNLSVPIEAVAPALLSAIFIAGRGQFKIQVKPDYFEAFTEYFIVVQHSGENKSAIVRFFRSVFEKFNESLLET